MYPAAFVSIVTATIRFTYTPNYPDTPPETCVTNSNLTTVQITELEQLLREQVSNVECLRYASARHDYALIALLQAVQAITCKFLHEKQNCDGLNMIGHNTHQHN